MEILKRNIISRKWIIEKRMEIAGRHKLCLNRESPCANVHGHNWGIIVRVEARELNKEGMVIDFSFISEVVKRLDHHHLNDVLGDLNPTAENIAEWIAEEIQKLIEILYPITEEDFHEAGFLVKVLEVSVQESEGNKALYLIS